MADDEDTEPGSDVEVDDLLPQLPPARSTLCGFCDDRETASAYMDLSDGERLILCWRCFALRVLQIDTGDLDLARTGSAAAGVLRDAPRPVTPPEPEEEQQPPKKPRTQATRTTSSLCDHPCQECSQYQVAFRCYSKPAASQSPPESRNICWACTAKYAILAHTGMQRLSGLTAQYNDPPRG